MSASGPESPAWCYLAGRAEPLGHGALCVAPGSGRSCVLYHVELTLGQRARELPRGGAVRERAGLRFCLGGAGGPLVEARDAELRWRGERLLADRARVGQLYARLGRGRPRALVRLREWRLEPGARVRVCGLLRRVRDGGGEGDYRAAATRLLLEAATIESAHGDAMV